MLKNRFFSTEVRDGVLIVNLLQPVGSLADSTVLAELDAVLQSLQQSGAKSVLVDMGQAAYFGSSLLEALRILWTKVEARQGRMALCNVSPLGLEILQLAKFDHLWPIRADQAAVFAEGLV